MAKIKKITNTNQYLFICPACNCEHMFDERWEFNGDFNNPTITPSFKQDGCLGFDANGNQTYGTCHLYIKAGKIEYQDDCTHELAGQTVNLPDFED